MGGGDGHPEMKASDRESNVDEWGRTGDGHPEMKASDRDGSIDAVICEVLIS